MASKLPPETCQQCGKTISRQAIANLFDMRVVCTGCYRKLASARCAREAEEAAAREPATERQIAYARDLGIEFDPAITKREMSALISAKVNPPATPQEIHEAQTFGVPTSLGVRRQELQDQLRERKTLVSWVYSVCRHLLRANWVYHRDSELDFSAVLWIAGQLEASEALSESVHEQYEGYDDDLDDWRYEYQAKPEPDVWYFFGRDGASTRCKAYRATAEMVRQKLGIAPATP